MPDIQHFFIDPRGLKVACPDERFDYILNVKHPEIKDVITKQMVMEAIENPNLGIIYADKEKTNTHVFYRKIPGIKKAELKVVVRFSSEVGELITFFLCSNRPSNEVIIWPPMNP